MARPTKALINLAALKKNYQLACSITPGGQCMPVVKANAYGHGASLVAKALEPVAPAFGVACLEEADELRSAGVQVPILLLEGVFNSAEVSVAASKNYWLMLSTEEHIAAVVTARLTSPIKVWLKIDSGMHRLGVSPDHVKAVYQRLQASNNVQQEIVLATHLACADELNNDASTQQLHLFRQSITGIEAPVSIANSPGLLGWPETRAEWNRPGYMLYGNSPFNEPHALADQLQAVMTLQSEIIALRTVLKGESVGYSANWTAQRTSLIATVAIGYGDGYPRNVANGTPVLINGQRAGLAGRVSMDMITVDVTDLAQVEVGDTVTLWGEELTANDLARYAGTIGYEVLTRMPMRTPRIAIN